MNSQNSRLTEGPVGRALLRFALPFLLASFLQALYGAADLFVVGRFTGSAAVSAVAIGSQVMQTITGIILGVSMGGTVLIAHSVGAKDAQGAARAVGTVTVLFGLLAAALTPVMLLCARPAAALMETPAEAMDAAVRYLYICACGIPFIIGYNAVSGIFRGMGDSKTPVLFIALACAINIAADFILTGALDMGAGGAAIATVTAQGISFFASLLYMKKRGLGFPFGRKDIALDRAAAGSILKVGLPLAMQDALVNVSFLVITAIINTLGVVASAAVGVVERIIGFAMLPPGSFASAVATVTAQNMGAGKPERAPRPVVRRWVFAGVRRSRLPVRPAVARDADRHFQPRPRRHHGGRPVPAIVHPGLRAGQLYFQHELLFQRLRPVGRRLCTQYGRHLRRAHSGHLPDEPRARLVAV